MIPDSSHFPLSSVKARVAIVSPEAIKAYVAWGHEEMGTRYVLLVGAVSSALAGLIGLNLEIVVLVAITNAF